MAFLSLSLIFTCFISFVCGHGMIQDPPQRSTLWRYYPEMGFEINYNDNELFCGGYSVQWFQNDGKCGTCGDPYDGAREHEAGGKYATGFIAKKYRQGQDIEVEIKLTANHLGFFEFKLCAHNDRTTPVTQECMDRTVLQLAGQPGVTRYEPGSRNGIHHVKLSLPADITCEQCVLQWRYKAGNSNNCDKYTGECCKGCGAQETFVNCADIAIDADDVKPAPSTTKPPQSTVAPTTTSKPITTIHPTSTSQPTSKTTQPKSSTQQSTSTTPKLVSTTTTQPSPTQNVTLGSNVTSCAANEVIDCLGVGVYEGLGYESWCNSYCGSGSTACTPDLCHCSCKRKVTCVAIGDYATRPGMDDWCTNTCQRGCDHLQDTCNCS